MYKLVFEEREWKAEIYYSTNARSVSNKKQMKITRLMILIDWNVG